MLKHRPLRRLLPAKQESHTRYGEATKQEKKQRISLACTECRKRRTKVSSTIFGGKSTDVIQCSGSTPCARCAIEACQCIYDFKSDRRRKPFMAELEESRAALCRVVAILRSGSTDQISRFIWKVQRFQTDQEAVFHVIGTPGDITCEEMRDSGREK